MQNPILYRWLKEFDSIIKRKREPVNKTPNELARLVWAIHNAYPDWGRHRISLQIALLGVFLSASTVRIILNRPYPPTNKKSYSEKTDEDYSNTYMIKAKHPNHVWSVDRTIVKRWGIWKTYVMLGIDHHSRKVVCCTPLEGPNAGWTIDVLESSIQRNGIPKYLISDHEPVIRSEAFAECLRKHGIQHRLGAVGKHGLIAVTERAIKTLKYEWLHRVHVIRGYRHLAPLCKDFEEWYNHWRPHTTVQSTPEFTFQENECSQKINKDSKVIQLPIEKKNCPETRISGFR